MSHQLISRSPDLKRLQDEGYHLLVNEGHLVVKDIPYVDAKREVKFGVLVSELTLAGDVTTRPGSHVAMFAGDFPCDRDGRELTKIKSASQRKVISEGLVVDHSFSSKPIGGYNDYYEKMVAYATILSSQAQSIDPSVTPKTFPVIETSGEESIFNYVDTASSRAGITAVTGKLVVPKIAILGVGGTGSYILDFVAKTPVGEIHLFDGDKFLQHNAFRSPGAPALEELAGHANKAEHFAGLYSRMRRGIIPHPYYLDASNVHELADMSFVFLSMDLSAPKKPIIENLEEFGVPFIDVGMGVSLIDGSLLGALRVTTSTPAKREHVRSRVSLSDGTPDNEYHRNIQIAELNALNAALAVVKWKKLCGFFNDPEKEHQTTYVVDGNQLLNEELG